jgi:tRNA(Ile)-lysidine synthase
VEQYYVIKAAMASIGASEQDFFMHGFEEIIRLTASSGSKQTKLGNKVFVRKQYRELTLSSAEFVVSIPEPLSVEEDRSRAVYGDYRFSFKILKVLPKKRDEGGFRVYLDADKVRFPFTIRSRQEGDRFIPLGMKQQKRLKEFFIDQKVPKFERDSIPLFDDGEKIFWVVGHRLDARVAIDSGSQRYLHVTAELVHEKPKRAASRIKKFGEDNESYEL